MRIWSLHPKHLDAKGLVALWRETLLAKNVLDGKTKGYKNHPQLIRFKEQTDPLAAINYYLEEIWHEAGCRKYNFNPDKFLKNSSCPKIEVTTGQFAYELSHLKTKLQKRDPEKLKELSRFQIPELHPLFRLVDGEIESWEVL